MTRGTSTSGSSYVNQNYDGTTAEWIIERPNGALQTADGFYPLANYTSETMTDDYALSNGSYQPINSFNNTCINMYQSGTLLSSISGLSSNGTFTGTWGNFD